MRDKVKIPKPSVTNYYNQFVENLVWFQSEIIPPAQIKTWTILMQWKKFVPHILLLPGWTVSCCGMLSVSQSDLLELWRYNRIHPFMLVLVPGKKNRKQINSKWGHYPGKVQIQYHLISSLWLYKQILFHFRQLWTCQPKKRAMTKGESVPIFLLGKC